MPFKSAIVAAALAAASLGAHATLTASMMSTSGSFLALTSTGAHTGTLGNVATIRGGAVLTGDYSYADSTAFGSPFGNMFLAAGTTATNDAVVSFNAPLNFVSFLWGSPDTYNTLTVRTVLAATGTTASYTYIPGGVGGLTFRSIGGSQDYAPYVSFTATAGESITSLTFSSSQDSFEAANFSVTSPVPEPESYAMLLGGLGALAFVSRRRRRV